MKGTKERPPIDNIGVDENDKWWEEKPGVKPYKFGETYDPNDKTKDYWLCPKCGLRKMGSPHINETHGEVQLICPRRHQWVLDVKTNTIEDTNRSLEFTEK